MITQDLLRALRNDLPMKVTIQRLEKQIAARLIKLVVVVQQRKQSPGRREACLVSEREPQRQFA